jgi:hypothetical protein
VIGPLLNAQAAAQNLPVVVTYLTFTIPLSPNTSGVSMVTAYHMYQRRAVSNELIFVG